MKSILISAAMLLTGCVSQSQVTLVDTNVSNLSYNDKNKTFIDMPARVLHQETMLGNYLSIRADNFYTRSNDTPHWISFNNTHKSDAIKLIDTYLIWEMNARGISEHVEKLIGTTGTPSHLFGKNVFTFMSGKPGKYYLIIHDTYTQHYHAYDPVQARKLRALLAKSDLDEVISSNRQPYTASVY